jgi:hypothetical protein
MYTWLYILSQFTVLLFSVYACILVISAKNTFLVGKFITLVVLIMALWLLFQRDTYLPFLGMAAFPPSLVPNQEVAPKGASKEVVLPINAPDGTRVIYWGALPAPSGAVARTPMLAYGDYSNAGVAIVKSGKATVRFACPGEYWVPMGQKLSRHIHYRLCCVKSGLFGPVQTMWVRC